MSYLIFIAFDGTPGHLHHPCKDMLAVQLLQQLDHTLMEQESPTITELVLHFLEMDTIVLLNSSKILPLHSKKVIQLNSDREVGQVNIEKQNNVVNQVLEIMTRDEEK